MLAMTSPGISSNQLPDHPNSYVVLLVENHPITTPSGQLSSVLPMTPHYSESGVGSGEEMLFFDPSDIVDDAGDDGGYRIVADIENSSMIPDEVLFMDVDGDKGGGSFEHVNWPVFLLFTIVMATIGGNVLVCLAVGYMRKLQNMFNYFLVSLALSDMLSAILIMPLSIVRSAVGKFNVYFLCIGG
jgi:7 transmembrane receptor (rhodopsin family)